MSNVEPTAGFRLQGRHVLFMVVGFFAVIIAVDGYFMSLAIKTFPGQVSATPFEDGLAYNRTLARHDAQARLGHRADAEAIAGRRRAASSLTSPPLPTRSGPTSN